MHSARLPVLPVLFLLNCTPGADVSTVRMELMEADRAFDAATAERGIDGWVAWFADDGAMYRAQSVVRGHTAIRGAMEPFFGTPGNQLRWDPVEAVASDDGTLGYTRGNYAIVVNGDTTSVGTYLTVWRRTHDGWRVIGDIGTEGVPVEPEAAP